MSGAVIAAAEIVVYGLALVALGYAWARHRARR